MRHPRGLYILFFTEMWERFSYYGMRALLMLYMVEALGLSVSRAGQLYGLYTACIYLTPLAGGLLADRVVGPHRAVMWGAVLMALGHFTMVLTPLPCFYTALTLLVVGCGLFKPNLSVLVGELYNPGDPRRERAFGLFYMGINLGAFLAPLVCGTLGQRLGWHVGFGCAGVGMLVGLAVFAVGRRHVVPASLAGAPPPPVAPLHLLGKRQVATVRIDPAAMVPFATAALEREKCAVRPLLPPELNRLRASDGPPMPSREVMVQRLLVLLALAIFGNVLFWSALEQAGSSIAIFVDRFCELHLFGASGWAMPSTWFQAANPLFIIVFTPCLGLLWGLLGAWQREPSTPGKFVLGLGLIALGFLVMRQAGAVVDMGQKVSLMPLLLASALNTLGELCISPVGLSAVTRLAPPRWGSVVMGGWFASIALANYGGGKLASYFGQVPHVRFFAVPMVLCGLAAVFLFLLTPRLKQMMHGVR